MEKKIKIAFIVQRYGLEICGGSEKHCRNLAELLSPKYDVTVLTSCSSEHVTCLPYYEEGISDINGIKVHRFKNKIEKDPEKANYYRKVMRGRAKLFFSLKWKRLLLSFSKKWNTGEEWIKMQGPFCEELVTYLENEHQQYDVLIFMTYLYYPTVFGIRVAPHKSILVPTAHDEKSIYFPVFRQFFQQPSFIMYNVEAEKNFVENLFHNKHIPNDIAGVGINEEDMIETESFKKTHHIDGDYILYVGRIDGSKGAKKLIEMFIQFKKKNNNNNLQLILVGQAFMEIPVRDDIKCLGFVSDEIKNSAMKDALLLVVPSQFESLSKIVLESLYFKVPVLVNGKCQVLVDHCLNSEAGFYYINKNEFWHYLDLALENKPQLKEMGEKGLKYVLDNYQWDTIKTKFEKAIDLILQKRK